MELILISDSKLKIMLTSDDMKEYSLDYSTLDYENTETRRAFWSILDEAKHRTGFDAASEKVFVQVYPSRGGGCEMYVTKLGIFSDRKPGDLEEDIRINEIAPRTGGGKGVKKCSYITTNETVEDSCSIGNDRTVFRFEELDMLLSVCKRLFLLGYAGESSAYSDKSAFYLLFQSQKGKRIGSCIKVRDLILEYAEELSADSFELYIGEHGRCICAPDAISTLGKL